MADGIMLPSAFNSEMRNQSTPGLMVVKSEGLGIWAPILMPLPSWMTMKSGSVLPWAETRTVVTSATWIRFKFIEAEFPLRKWKLAAARP